MLGAVSAQPLKVLGRYALHEPIAAGGMATVHYGRLLGPVGFARTVAIKRLHERLAMDPEFTSMFLDEARLAARIRHPNVVPTLDVVATEGELFLVMEYVQGESLSRLYQHARQGGDPIPPAIVTTVLIGALHGLHAAHEATDENGRPLGIVHRDVSPQNILVGADGVPRVLDFGVAKAVGRAASTRDGQLKGKLAYMAPEQLNGQRALTRAVDVYAAGVVLWEGLAGRKLFAADSEAELVGLLLQMEIEPPSKFAPAIKPELDAIVMKALARDPAARFATARDMARALEKTCGLVPASDIGEWVEHAASEALTGRKETIAKIEASSGSSIRVAELVEQIQSTRSPTGSQPEIPLETSTTLRMDDRPPSKDRRALVVVAVAAVFALIGLVLGVVSLVKRGDASPASIASAATPPPSSPPVEVAATVDPSAQAPAIVVPSATSAQPTASAAPSVRAAPPVHYSAPRVNCDPPYTTDASGNRHYKRECLK